MEIRGKYELCLQLFLNYHQILKSSTSGSATGTVWSYMQAQTSKLFLVDISPKDLADADAGYNLAIVVVDRLDGGRSEQNMNCALHNVQTRSMMMHFLKNEQNGV